MAARTRKTFLGLHLQTKTVVGLIVVTCVAAAGTYVLVISHAASPYASQQAASGTVSMPASITSDPTASGGKSVVFGNNSCPFTNPMGCNWYIGAPVLTLLYKADPSLAQKYFDHPTTFVAVTESAQLSSIPSGWNVTPIFTSFDGDQLAADVTNKAVTTSSGTVDSPQPLPAGIKGVTLDDEFDTCQVYGSGGDCTPAPEQANPVPYEEAVSQDATAAGLIYLDVGADPDASNSNNRWHAAAFANYVDSQIQFAETDTATFTAESSSYVAGWQSALKTYNTASHYEGVKSSTAQVIDGITAKVPDCSGGNSGCETYVTANPSDMVAAVKATMTSGVWGYWLNCPGGTTPGPGPCDQDDVNAMVSFLESMEAIY
jgi:hypothetical protein